MKIAILSDIHANLTALNRVLKALDEVGADGLLFLGDILDYGMRPNECILALRQCKIPFMAGIWGNHEEALFCGTDRFSNQRAKICSAYTKRILTEDSLEWLHRLEPAGKQVIPIEGKTVLCIHGSLADPFWGDALSARKDAAYAGYDMVFAGHTHRPYYVESYFPSECLETRNEKKTVFINPGSIGQPRNHNIHAQYAIWDTVNDTVSLCKAPYAVAEEQAFFTEAVDSFYRNRLERGI